mgnify:CR=1 FL=1
MKIQIINHLDMQWVDSYKNIFPEADWNLAPKNGYDVTLWMWGIDIDTTIEGKHVVFVRRYEWYLGEWQKWDESRISDIICVNDFIGWQVSQVFKGKVSIIYNAIDTNKWTYKERKHGEKIAWVGFINMKKNIPLSLQIMSMLPKGYELHIAGGCQDWTVFDYMNNMAKSLCIKVIWENHIPSKAMNKWLEDKNYLLSTALSEGCPNNVLEAIAKGIKPIVHNWPGAYNQFGSYVFNMPSDAVSMINPNSEYDSIKYKALLDAKFSINNYQKVRDIVCKI